MKKYYIDEKEILISDVKKRICETDLVPSRISLLENIDRLFSQIENVGIKTLFDLRRELKSPHKVKLFSDKADLDEDYVILLRREINSYFPKAYRIKEFHWLSAEKCENFFQRD